MQKYYFIFFLLISIILSRPIQAQNNIDLEQYIIQLKEDKAGPLKYTGYLSAGSDFLYAQEFFEAKSFSSAEWYFLQAVNKQKDNAFANYQLGISLLKQNEETKKHQAQEYLKAAFELNPLLKDRYAKDMGDTVVIKAETDAEKTLEDYIARLKQQATTGSVETALGTAGYEALYGVNYFEANKYDSAETSFALSLQRNGDHIYVNYLMAVALAAQGKKDAAKPYLQKAFSKDASLLQRFNKDVANAAGKWQIAMDAKKEPDQPVSKPTVGGPLLAGNYTCQQSVWNGPNKSIAFSYKYKGYFELKSNGTYRWLDNGETGKYLYNAKSGDIKWLSGYFKNAGVNTTQYRVNKQTTQITLNFSETNRWECSCKK